MQRISAVIVRRKSVMPFAGFTVLAAIATVVIEFNALWFLVDLSTVQEATFGSVAFLATILFAIPTVAWALFVDIAISWGGRPKTFLVRFVPQQQGRNLARNFIEHNGDLTCRTMVMRSLKDPLYSYSLTLGGNGSCALIETGNFTHTRASSIWLNWSRKPFGSEVRSSIGYTFWALKPTTHDLIMHSARKTQIMYPKDIGLIILKLALTSGAKVLEIGTGSGAMTVAAAMAVRPDGHVHTYEAEGNSLEVAERNLKRASVLEFVTIHQYRRKCWNRRFRLRCGHYRRGRPMADNTQRAQGPVKWSGSCFIQPYGQSG